MGISDGWLAVERAEALAAKASTDPKGAFAETDALYADLVQAFHVLREAGDHEGALRLCLALRPYWTDRGRLEEARHLLVLALASGPPSQRRVDGYCFGGYFAFRQGDQAEAHWMTERSLNEAEHIGYHHGAAMAHLGLCRVGLRDHDFEAVRNHGEAARAIWLDLGDQEEAVKPPHMLAEAARMEGDFDTARPLYEESLAAARARGDKGMVATELFNLSCVDHAEGRLGDAEARLRESFETAECHHDDSSMAYALIGLGCVASVGRPEYAAVLLSAGAALLGRRGQVLDPADQPDFDRARDTARTTLGEAAFQSAWARGQEIDPRAALSVGAPEPDAVA